MKRSSVNSLQFHDYDKNSKLTSSYGSLSEKYLKLLKANVIYFPSYYYFLLYLFHFDIFNYVHIVLSYIYILFNLRGMERRKEKFVLGSNFCREGEYSGPKSLLTQPLQSKIGDFEKDKSYKKNVITYILKPKIIF